MAGPIDLVREGFFQKGANVGFLHTGGRAGLFGCPDASGLPAEVAWPHRRRVARGVPLAATVATAAPAPALGALLRPAAAAPAGAAVVSERGRLPPATTSARPSDRHRRPPDTDRTAAR